jgi:predicted DNA-binding transcriptional regulator AlpA
MSDQSTYTVDEFCRAERISRSMIYKLWSQGQGPRFYMVGTVRRISHQARLEWQQQMEAASGEIGGAR